jgi:16S rRNA (cytosine1402-N4)-methyltransferase
MDMPAAAAYHTPVLVAEVVELLRGTTRVLDGTLGGGGHTEALLEAGVGSVVGVDRDTQAVTAARARLDEFVRSGRFTTIVSNYADIAASDLGADLGGVLLDLGVSSHQFDDAERGFTFREGAPLDMRMETSETSGDAAESAADLLNTADVSELTRIFKDFGDERKASRLASAIVHRRAKAPFATADDLVNAIRSVLGPRSGAPDFARLFQAVRIAVNDEIGGLQRALPAFRDQLTTGGVIAVITYHSGEDRVVKHAFREWSAECVCPPRQPKCTCRGRSLGETITRRAVAPSAAEIERNPRARSAKLRAWRKA